MAFDIFACSKLSNVQKVEQDFRSKGPSVARVMSRGCRRLGPQARNCQLVTGTSVSGDQGRQVAFEFIHRNDGSPVRGPYSFDLAFTDQLIHEAGADADRFGSFGDT